MPTRLGTVLATGFLMENFKKIAKEMRAKLEEVICVGPVGELDQRLDQLLNDFERSIAVLADDEAIKRATVYLKQFNNVLDGEPVFNKDEAIKNDNTP